MAGWRNNKEAISGGLPGKIVSPQVQMQPEGGYREFRIGSLFEIKKGKRLTKANMHPGDINFIGATDSNNGKTASVANNTHIHPANTISVTYNGSVGNAFYQIEPYWASDDVNVFYPKFPMTELIALYFLAPLTKKGKQYAYDCKWTKEKMEKDTIFLPVDATGEIDFEFMSSRIRELEEERIRELEAYLKACGFEDTTPTPPEINTLRDMQANKLTYKEFRVVDMFDVSNTHCILKSEVVYGSGATPYITAGEGNNSVASYIAHDPSLIEPGHSVMIGGKTMVITYQPKDFFSNDSHNLLLRHRSTESTTENTSLFFVAALRRSLCPKYHWGDSISKAKIARDTLMLPVDANGQPAYATMEHLVNGIKKSVISRIKDFMRKERDAYTTIVHPDEMPQQRPESF